MPLRSEEDIRNNNLDKFSEQEKASKIYSTKIINKILDQRAHGIEADMNPFYHGNPSYRDSGIIYQYTDEELKEIERCASDCTYFVAKYCKFLNDKGWSLITLRDYQKRMLNLYSAEVWDDSLNDFRLKNRFVIGLASRQTGKCLLGTTLVKYKDKNGRIKLIKIKDLFKEKFSILQLIKKFLYFLYEKL